MIGVSVLGIPINHSTSIEQFEIVNSIFESIAVVHLVGEKHFQFLLF
jgi:pyrroline-5-carboxylate reductase